MKNTIKRILLGVTVCAVVALNVGIVYRLFNDSSGFGNMKFYSEAFANGNANMAQGTGGAFNMNSNANMNMDVIQH